MHLVLMQRCPEQRCGQEETVACVLRPCRPILVIKLRANNEILC